MFQITVSPDCSQATAISITSDALSVRYPRVLQYHGGSVLVYLSNTRGGEHSKCARLHKRRLPLNLASQEDNDVLVDIVYQAETPETFPGLYTDCPASQFTLKVGNGEEKKTYLVLSSIWRCRQTILTVDLETGAVIDQGTGEMDSYTFLGSDNRTRLLAVRSSLITPPELVLGILEASEQPRIKWKVIKTWAYDFEVGKHCEYTPNFAPMSCRCSLFCCDSHWSYHTILHHCTPSRLEEHRSTCRQCVPTQ